MPLVSSKVAAGTEILADHFNKLREDLLTNHDHSSGKGGTVDHAHLAETGEMSGMGHRHEDIDVHLLAGGPGPNDIDNPGGDKGVHGLAALGWVAGCIDYSNQDVPIAKQIVFRTGVKRVENRGGGIFGFLQSFAPSFSGIQGVIATPAGNAYSQDGHNLRIVSQGITGFELRCTAGLNGFNVFWVAFGTLTD